MKTGELPHLSLIDRKHEPLGTEFNNLAFEKTGIFIVIDLKRGENDISAPDQGVFNAMADVSTHIYRHNLNNRHVSSYILSLYLSFHVDAQN